MKIDRHGREHEKNIHSLQIKLSLSNVNRKRDIRREVSMVLLFGVLIRLTLEKTRSTVQDVIGSVIRAFKKHGFSGKRPHCICPSLQ